MQVPKRWRRSSSHGRRGNHVKATTGFVGCIWSLSTTFAYSVDGVWIFGDAYMMYVVTGYKLHLFPET
jgi:hypothetical protein